MARNLPPDRRWRSNMGTNRRLQLSTTLGPPSLSVQFQSHMDLALVLQRLYDSEIGLTITMLPDGGFDFALISYMEWEDAGRPIDYMEMIASVEPQERPDRPNPGMGSSGQTSSPPRFMTPRAELWIKM